MRSWKALSTLAAAALCATSLPAGAETLKVTYEVSLIGLPLGSADLATVVDGTPCVESGSIVAWTSV